MFQYHTFYENDDDLVFNLTHNNYYRSSVSRKEIKHCFEFEILENKTLYQFEVGFSCAYDSRTFVSVYHPRGIMRKISDSDNDNQYFDCDAEYKKGDIVEVCYDSIQKNFSVFNNNYHCSQIVSFDSPVTWFAYLDHSDTGSDMISLNLGMNKFSNQIPKGYEPWYIDFNSYYMKRHSIAYLNKPDLKILTALFIMLSQKQSKYE